MQSLYDELSARLGKDPSLTRRGGPRADIGLMLFSERDSLAALWKAADRHVRLGERGSLEELEEAVGRLRPFFGERD